MGDTLPRDGRRKLAPWEIRARRKNARKSTGPQTAAGKRRSALNALKGGLGSRALEGLVTEEDGGRRELRKIILDLMALFRPEDAYLQDRIEGLAHRWWEKAQAMRARQIPLAYDSGLQQLNRGIEEKLDSLIPTLQVRSRKWYCRLERAVGGPIAGLTDLRMKIEAHMSTILAVQRELATDSLRRMKKSGYEERSYYIVENKGSSPETMGKRS